MHAHHRRRGRSAPAARPRPLAVIRAYSIVTFLIVVCGTLGLAMIMQGTITFITCQFDQAAAVSCSAEARVLGVLPIRHQSITNVRKVEATVHRYERTGFSNKGVDYHDQLVFDTTDGSRIVVRLGDGWKVGTPVADIEQQINALLQHRSQQTLTFWHGSLKGFAFLILGLLPFAVSLVLLGAVIYGHYRVLRQRITTRSFMQENICHE